MSKSTNTQHTARLLTVINKFQEQHNIKDIQQSLLKAQRYALLYSEEIAHDDCMSGVVESTLDVCALLDYLFTNTQDSVFELPQLNLSDGDMLHDIHKELMEEQDADLLTLQDESQADSPHQYRNLTDVESIEGMEVDKGALWDKRGDKLVLIDEDEYITHDFNTKIFKIAN